MIGNLFNAPIGEGSGAVGTSCVGSSEAIILGVLAMKRRWKNKRKAEGKSTENPNIIMNSAVQVCWEKVRKISSRSRDGNFYVLYEGKGGIPSSPRPPGGGGRWRILTIAVVDDNHADALLTTE